MFKNKIYITQDERMKEQTGEIIIHKFVVSTFKKCKLNRSIPMKLTIDSWDNGKKEKQFVNVVIKRRIDKRYFEGVIL